MKTTLKSIQSKRLTLNEAVRCLSTASLITAATVQAQDSPVRSADDVLGESFSSFLHNVSTTRLEERQKLIRAAVDRIRSSGNALVTDSTVHFIYSGPGKAVFVPSDLNGWNPRVDSMLNIAGTDLFHLTKRLPARSRFEYKFMVDSTWVLDPINPRKTVGGYGYNSEVWMPGYEPSQEIQSRPGVQQGRIDTLLFRSDTLGRTHPVMVYLPFGYGQQEEYESIWVTDGGEYLSLGLMKTILDNLIHDRRIRPVVGVFVDPRTDPRDPGTSKRMDDYAMSDRFLQALVMELRPRILRDYRIRRTPAVIMGASLGGLFATYAACSRSDVFGGSAAQSPAYWWNNRAIYDLVRSSHPEEIKFYIDTGTINDAQAESSAMKNVLRELGCQVTYAEYPEGHNWVNWRARVDEILEYFFRGDK